MSFTTNFFCKYCGSLLRVIVPLVIQAEGLNKHLVNLLFREGLAGGGQFAALT
tara:strand:- start:154 stop:312 length:159 start_codon:yes stop_codon:yes gene_type:complete